MTIKIGITGGIGSGKSVVSELLSVMGIPVYISDIKAKELTVINPGIRKELTLLLGKDIYIDNRLNKKLLADYLFSSPEHARIVNGIIHPRVKEDFRKWTKQHASRPVVAMESAILIEAGFVEEVDKLIMVHAPLDLRITRVMQRDGIAKESVLQRIKSQMSDEEKIKLANYVILNDNETPLIPQVLKLTEELLKPSL